MATIKRALLLATSILSFIIVTHSTAAPLEVLVVSKIPELPDGIPNSTFSIALSHAIDTMQQDTVAESDAPPRLDPRTVQCMAKNIYFEAGTESFDGKMAVGHVVLNRTKDPHYPDTACGVIYQAVAVRKKSTPVRIVKVCQFSWVCAAQRQINTASKAWEDSVLAATKLLTMNSDTPGLGGATSFHAKSVSPRWRSSLVRVKVIDNHIFYRQR